MSVVPKTGSLAVFIYALLAAVGGVLAYFLFRGGFPLLIEVALPFFYVLIVAFLVGRRGGVSGSQSGSRPIGVRLLASDLTKSIICFAISVLWVAFAASVTHGSTLGNAIIGVPSLSVLAIGGYFFGKFFWKRLRP